jgi:hypothetical protein
MDFAFIVLYCLTFHLRRSRVFSSFSPQLGCGSDHRDSWNPRPLGELPAARAISHAGIRRCSRRSAAPAIVSEKVGGDVCLGALVLGIRAARRENHTANPALTVMAAFIFLAAGSTTIGLFRNKLIGISVLCLFPALLTAGASQSAGFQPLPLLPETSATHGGKRLAIVRASLGWQISNPPPKRIGSPASRFSTLRPGPDLLTLSVRTRRWRTLGQLSANRFRQSCEYLLPICYQQTG